MKLYLVGKILIEHASAWEFIGVCDSLTRALQMCGTDKYFLSPVVLNEEAPSESVIFPEYFFPLAGDEISNPIPAWAEKNKGGLL